MSTSKFVLDQTQDDAGSPRMRRITLGGGGLDGFTSAAADDHWRRGEAGAPERVEA